MINKIDNISFEARIGDIPKMSCLSKEQHMLKNLKMKGYTALIGADVYTPSNKIAKQNLLFKDNTLFAIDEFEPYITDSIQYVLLDN